MERVVSSLVANPQSRFHHAIVCMTGLEANRVPLPTNARVEVVVKPRGHSLVYLWRLAAQLRRMRPDLLCTYNWNGMDGILAGRLARVPRIIQCEHGWASEDATGSNRRRQRIRRLLSRWTAAQICVSQGLQRWLEQDVRVHCRVIRIHNGVDPEVYRPGPTDAALVRELRLEPGQFVIGAIARHDRIKNHQLLFEAFSRLRCSNPEVRLLLIGDGPERAQLELIAPEGVEFLGVRPDVPRLLRVIDVVAVPSHNEGISLVILEAMASARPVVACAVGGNADLVEDQVSGVLMPADDPAAMAMALQGYLDSPRRCAEHGAAGRDRISRYFSVDEMMRSYETAYDSVLAAPTR